jgi:hypothetical protein
MIFALFGLASYYLTPRIHPRLPFYHGTISRDDYGPVVVSLTEKEAKRCIEAIDWYIESFAPEMEKRGLDKEIGRYEDLMYRFMSVPDDEFRIKGRREDQLS